MIKSYFFVFVQFVCIIFLLKEVELFKTTIECTIQLSAVFIGLYAIYESRKGQLGILPDVRNNSRLITSGPFRIIRHPMYLSILLFFSSSVILQFSWIILGCYVLLFINLALKLRYEERLLSKHYPEYTEYKKNTFRLIPFVY